MKNFYFTIVFLTLGLLVSAQSEQENNIGEITLIKRIGNNVEINNPIYETGFTRKGVLQTTAPTGSSAEVGLTEGQLSVSLNGNANYSIPITVPKGINEVEPVISISYNSQNGLNGNAARGWDITGISSITRIPSTKFHDGVIDPVDFNILDRFALDGQRLIVKNGTAGIYGADKTVYETEYFSNVKITSYGISPFGANYGPAYFLVEYPDGSKAYYGNSGDSRSIMEWSIMYFENAQGVRINYTYLLLNNTLYIDTVKYGASGSNVSPNEVKFIYEDRGFPENGYVGGQNIIRSKRLQAIKVITGGIGFRNYSFSYLEVDRINKVTETSGDGTKSYNPTFFEYDMNSEERKYLDITTSLNIGNMKSLNVAAVSGDFDGDGKMDCLVYPTIGTDAKAKYWLYSNIESGETANMGLEHKVGFFDDIFPATFLSPETKVLPQGWVVVKNNNPNFTFSVYGTERFLASANIIKHYDRVVSIPKTIVPRKIVSGDFNGDGLTDVLVIDNQSAKGFITASRQVYFIDLKRDKTTDFLTFPGMLVSELSETASLEVADFNGDGKSDLFVFDRGFMTIYSLNIENKLIVLYRSTSIDSALATGYPTLVATRFPILVGDFNGDGKSDVMIPKAYGSSQWYKYTSTGTTFIKEEKSYQAVFNANDSYHSYNYIASDFNSDGKTDLIQVTNYAQNSNGYINLSCYSNRNGDFTAAPMISSTGNRADINLYALPVYLPQSLNSSSAALNSINSTLEIAFFNQNKIHFFSSGGDYKKQNLLTKITTGNGVQETISYIPLDSQFANTYQNTTIYKSSKGISSYPDLDILVDPNLYVVSQLEKQSKDVYKKKLFAYYGAVSNLEGIGFKGFRSVSRTDWYNDPSLMFSTITKNSIDLRGATSENYFVLGFRAPLTTVRGTNSSPDAPADFITKVIFGYEDFLMSNKVFRLRNNITSEFNALTGTNSQTNIDFDVYHNPLKMTRIIKEGSSTIQTTVSNTSYYNNAAVTPYIIGRPVSNTQSVDVAGSAMSFEELYDYNAAGLLTKIRRKGANTNTIAEDNQYDYLGNMINKKITAVGLAPRETSYEYDSSGRFVTKITDNEKLSTLFVYNQNGTLKSETNPYNLTTSYAYDSWFKMVAAKDEKLDKTILYAYTKNGVNTIVTTTTDALDGSASEETFDDLGRKIKSGQKDLNGNFSFVSFMYDVYDRNYRMSEPYFGSAPSQWNETKYDIYSRPEEFKFFNTRTTATSYNGLITTIVDGQKAKSFTKNALGSIISSTETTGGTIKYDYFANGNLKQTDYNGVKIDIEQDGWGRKAKMTDPSAGIYTYKNNDLGELEMETSKNGEVATTITRDASGKPVKKTVIGSGTETITDYEYDSSTKLLTKTTFTDKKESAGSNQIVTTYTYDDIYKRVIQITEDKTGVSKFITAYTYDGLGRIDTETKQAQLGVKISSVKIKREYKNGFLYKIVDDATKKILWQTNALNAKGQILESIFGNGIKMTNEYDTNGYLSKMQYDKTNGQTGNVLTLSTKFDFKTDNLENRTNGAFSNYTESFKYDELDRLNEFTNRKGVKEIQNYEASGKIRDNNLGVYNYSKDKPYQNTSISLTPEAYGFYANREGAFSSPERKLDITYNAFKSPLQISETTIDKISFSYNDNNDRSTMYYGSLGDEVLRPLRKHYAADGTIEIKENRVTGGIEFITYIGGDGYSAPVVMKNDGVNEGSYLYLHRDYQGSILAITDANANIVEKRLFDAWGSIVKVQDGAGNTLAGLTVLDRGYTGHEHLQSVGLINMNARLYDPMLHRFLQVDNYIQDPTNTQNYNQYGYVLNNPLKYTDPSGNKAQGNGKDCVDCGPSETNQTLIGNGLKFIKDNWDNWGIKDWAKKNLNFKKWFGGGGKSSEPVNRSSYANIQMPTQHSSLGFNWTYLSQGKPVEKFIYTIANGINTTGQYFMGRSVGDYSMRNLDGSSTSTDEAVMGLVDVYTGIIGITEVKFALSEVKAAKGVGGFGSMMNPDEAARYTKYWTRYAPKQISPGEIRTDWFRVSGRTGRTEASRVIYDNYGRQIYRVDYSDHMRSINHSVPHLHQYEFGIGSSFGKETVFNFF